MFALSGPALFAGKGINTDHDYKHNIRTAGPFPFKLFPTCRDISRNGLGAVPQFTANFDVTEGDDNKWDDEL